MQEDADAPVAREHIVAKNADTQSCEMEPSTVETPVPDSSPVPEVPAPSTVHAMDGAVTSSSSSIRARLGRYLSKHIWTGVGAIASVAAVIVAIILGLIPFFTAPAKTTPPATPPTQVVNNQSGGDCQVQGDNNQVDCNLGTTPR